jgi:hypothetical protein
MRAFNDLCEMAGGKNAPEIEAEKEAHFGGRDDAA